jgi:DNA polymerase-3 subunit epsilon
MPAELPPFVAIDFETADYGRDSACAVALVRVENGEIVARMCQLLRPPRQHIHFSYLHGITWERVADEPTFAEAWPRMTPILEGATFLVAHNATFDESVLTTCCENGGIVDASLPFRCTMRLARATWNLYPTKLPDVCRFLGLALNHHDAMSDAEACAQIMLAAHRASQETAQATPEQDRFAPLGTTNVRAHGVHAALRAPRKRVADRVN